MLKLLLNSHTVNLPEHFQVTNSRLSGDRLAEQIKQIRSDVPVILCTGYSAGIDEKKARNSGIDAFLTKPMERSQVAFALRRVLEARPGP